MSDDITSNIKDQLESGGNIGASDLADFNRDADAPTGPDPEEYLTQTDTVKVPQDAMRDQIMETGGEQSAQDEIAYQMGMDAVDGNLPFEVSEEDIDITPDDKISFIETLINDERWEMGVSLLGDKLQVRFRSRTNQETDALMGELQRRVDKKEIVSGSDYSNALRNALLRFQVAVYNNKEYPLPEAPLKAQVEVKDKKEHITPPAWVEEANAFFGDEKPEAIAAILYQALQKFEKKYWTMVKYSDDQNFWDPEDSTSE